MRNRLSTVFGFLALMIAFSCQDSNEIQTDSIQYFDMHQFVQNEIEQLNKQNKTLKKIIYANDTSDTLFIQKPDWQKELQVFSSSNINKPTLYATYQVDTNVNIIQYQSLKTKNKVEALSIHYTTSNLSKIEKIEIRNRQENFITQSTEFLLYQPTQGYSIDIQQNLISQQGNAFKVVGVISDEID